MFNESFKNIAKAARVAAAGMSVAALSACNANTSGGGGVGQGVHTWSADEILGSSNGGITIDQNTVSNGIKNFAQFIIAMAVVFFVLRVVLTAVDRMVFANLGAQVRVPFSYPNPGDDRWDLDDKQNGLDRTMPWTWKRIWLNFAKNIGIAAAAWLLVQLVVAMIQFVLGNVSV